MFRPSTNKCYNELFKLIEFFLKYKLKRNEGLFKHFKMTYFHLECQNLIKNIKLCIFFAPTFFIFLSKPLECIFVIF